MILDLIEKLPDWATGTLVAGGIWFGFNYVVLAERAMAKEAQTGTVSSCVMALDQYQSDLARKVPDIGLSDLFDHPALDLDIVKNFERKARALMRPRVMDDAEKSAKCLCASELVARSARLDYAIHTATFRVIKPEAVAAFRDATVGKVMEGVCGSLPQARTGG